MVSTGPEPVRPEPRRLDTKGALVAIAVLLAGGVGLGLLTGGSTTPEATATTVRQPAAPPSTNAPLTEEGVPFDWQLQAEFDGYRPVNMIEWNDEVLLFANRLDDSTVSGLNLMVVNTEEVSSPTTVISPEYVVHQVTPTPMGLVAVGYHRSHRTSRVWISDEGRVWAVVNFPAPQDNWISSAHHVGGNLVLFGSTIRSGSWVEDLTGAAEELTGFTGWRVQGSDQATVVLTGPLDIPYRALTADELGLDPADYPTESWQPPSLILVRHSNGTWHTGDLELEYYPASVFTGPDDLLWMEARASWLPGYVTADGITWHQGGPPQGFSVNAWGDGWVRSSPEGPSSFSTDGATWNPFRMPEFMTAPASHEERRWNRSAVHVSEQGLGLVATKWENLTFPDTPEEAPVSLERDGFTLTISSDLVRLLQGDVVQTTINRQVGLPSARVGVDPDERTVTFFDGAGNVQTSFSFDELEAIRWPENDFASEIPEPGVEQVAFIHSPDGFNWAVQDVTDLVRSSAGSTPFYGSVGIEVIDNRVYLFLGIRLWAATIPGSEP